MSDRCPLGYLLLFLKKFFFAPIYYTCSCFLPKIVSFSYGELKKTFSYLPTQPENSESVNSKVGLCFASQRLEFYWRQDSLRA